MLQFWEHFAELFGGDAASGISNEIAANLTKIEHTPFTPSEIKIAADQMKPGKSSELATFRVEQLLRHRDTDLWHMLALLFNHCVANSYPQRLNQMLLLPLHKKGAKNNPDNYLGISLIHPIGRLFSKVVTNRLESDNHATRAACQLGFHY